MRKRLYLYLANALIFMGSLWQLEIADLCLTNGWPFGYLFTFLQFPLSMVWAVRDFWMMMLLGSFLLASAESLYWAIKRDREPSLTWNKVG
jgi:hypothetical protein